MSLLTKGVLAAWLTIFIGSNLIQGQLSSSTPKDKLKNFTPKLPKNLCNSCNVNEKTISEVDGSFLKPDRIFNIWSNVDRPCARKMKEYVDLNPEDTITAEAWKKFSEPANDQEKQEGWDRLERIAYTFCELCCDCIDIDSAKEVPKLDIYRPNCGLHHVYDISTPRGVFPDMQYQDYATGQIIKPEYSLPDDMEVWLKCFQQANGGRVKVRSDVGIDGYHDRRRRLRGIQTSPQPTLLDGELMLASAQTDNQTTRKMLQTEPDCSMEEDVKAAVARVFEDLEAVNYWVGCHKKRSYAPCHYMEFAQGRVCGDGQSAMCIGKNWSSQ